MTIPQTVTTQELMNMDYRYNYSDRELTDDWTRLCRTTVYKRGAQFKPGMKLCQHYMPNFWDIEDANGNSFARAWQDYALMDKVRLWGLQGMSQLWMSWIIRAVYMTAGLPNSSFYRPHFAKQIIEEHSDKLRGVLFDPCAGWGGRMLGTAAAGWDYYSCEPNVDTYKNLQQMIQHIKPQTVTDIANLPVEDFDIEGLPPIDIVLTSPPYFNLEVYTKGDTQSYNRHSTYAEWRDDWLVPLINRCLNKLEHSGDRGISAWNVMNFGKNDFSGDVIKAHTDRGWQLVGTVGFDSPLANIRKLKNKDVTYIFKKPLDK